MNRDFMGGGTRSKKVEITGYGIGTEEIKVPDLNNYDPEFYNCHKCEEEIEKHIIQDGAYYHVPHWDSNGKHCSAEKCEINHRHVCKGKDLEDKTKNN